MSIDLSAMTDAELLDLGFRVLGMLRVRVDDDTRWRAAQDAILEEEERPGEASK